MTFIELTEKIAVVIEAAGALIMIAGIVISIFYSLKKLLTERAYAEAYDRLRHGIGRSLMLGLDLLIASEIMRSILAETLESVTVLGLTIVIRTFLSLTLEIEIEGQLPWRRRENERT